VQYSLSRYLALFGISWCIHWSLGELAVEATEKIFLSVNKVKSVADLGNLCLTGIFIAECHVYQTAVMQNYVPPLCQIDSHIM